MRLTDTAIDRPLMVVLGTLIVFAIGAWALLRIPVERDPEVVIPVVVATVPWPGATPADIEREIADPMEQRLRGLADIDWLHINSVEGACVAIIRFTDGTNAVSARRDVKDRVDLARGDFPDEAEEPAVIDIRLDSVPVVLVTVAGGNDPTARKTIADHLADRIGIVPDVSEVELFGGRERLIRVQCDPVRLGAYGLTFDDVADAIAAWHMSYPGGKVELRPRDADPARRDWLVRVTGEVDRVAALADLPLIAPDGGRFPLRDVARVVPGFRDPHSFSRIDGDPCVTCVVYRRGGVNTLSVVGQVRAAVADFERTLPDDSGIRLHVTQDVGKEIRLMMGQLGSSAAYGAILVFALLIIAVGWRNALLVAFAIPFTVLITVAALNALGETVNAVTLFGMIVILGLVVDGAVIVGENIFRHIEEGMPPVDAAKIGIHEVGRSVIIADITTVCAFAPLLILSGPTGEYLSPLPLVVAVALTASVIIDHLVLPALAGRLIPGRKRRLGFVSPFETRPTGGDDETGDRRRRPLIGRAVAALGAAMRRQRKPAPPDDEPLADPDAADEPEMADDGESREADAAAAALAEMRKAQTREIVSSESADAVPADAAPETGPDALPPEDIVPPVVLPDLPSRPRAGDTEVSASASQLPVPPAGSGLAPSSDEHEIDGVRFRRVGMREKGGVRRFVAVAGRRPRATRAGDTGRRDHRMGGSGSAGIRFLRRRYAALLGACMKLHWLVFAMVTASVIAGVVLLFSGMVGLEFMPNVDRSRFFVRLEMPVGTPLEETAAAMRRLEQAVAGLIADADEREIESWVTTAGQTNSLQSDIRESGEQGPEFAKLQIELVEIGQRTRSQWEILTDLRSRLPEIPGSRITVEEVAEGPRVGMPVSIRLLADSYDELRIASRELEAQLALVPGLRDISRDYRPARPELWVQPDRRRADALDVPTGSIVAAARGAVYGIDAGDIEIADEDIEIHVEVDPSYLSGTEGMRALRVRSAGGHLIPVGMVADVTLGTGARKLQRRDGSRTAAVRADLHPGVRLGDVLPQIRQRVAASETLQRLGARFEDTASVPPTVSLRFEGETEGRDRAFGELGIALGTGLLLVCVVLAGYLNSLVQAGILLITVPLGFLGVMVGLLITGNTFNTLSFMGMVALTGIVVNDAVVLVDYINYRRRLEPRTPLREVVMRAAVTRLRPVLVTTFTTIGGMLPLALNWSGGGRFWEPLAWAIIFGVAFATTLTLIVIPVLFNYLLNPDEGLRAELAALRASRDEEDREDDGD